VSVRIDEQETLLREAARQYVTGKLAIERYEEVVAAVLRGQVPEEVEGARVPFPPFETQAVRA